MRRLELENGINGPNLSTFERLLGGLRSVFEGLGENRCQFERRPERRSEKWLKNGIFRVLEKGMSTISRRKLGF